MATRIARYLPRLRGSMLLAGAMALSGCTASSPYYASGPGYGTGVYGTGVPATYPSTYAYSGYGYAPRAVVPGSLAVTRADSYCREAWAEAADAERTAAMTRSSGDIARAQRSRSYLSRDC